MSSKIAVRCGHGAVGGSFQQYGYARKGFAIRIRNLAADLRLSKGRLSQQEQSCQQGDNETG